MSQQAKFAITQQLRLLSKLYPQYKVLIPDWIEEVEEMNVVLTGQPMSRVFRSIDQGYQLESEIARRTGLDDKTLKRLLAEMLDAGVIRAIPQGGKTDGARGARKMLYERIQPAVTANVR